jgi:hypothetical protein
MNDEQRLTLCAATARLDSLRHQLWEQRDDANTSALWQLQEALLILHSLITEVNGVHVVEPDY